MGESLVRPLSLVEHESMKTPHTIFREESIVGVCRVTDITVRLQNELNIITNMISNLEDI